MRALVLTVPTPDAAEERVEVALVDANGQALAFDALKAAATALLGEETGCSLKYVDSDGDMVTIASDADVREASEYMQDEGLERLAVKVIPHRNLVRQHVKGIVAAVAALAQKIDRPVTKKPTVKSTFELLLQVVSEWDVSKDAEVLTSLKTDLIKLLSDKRLSFAVEELSQTEKYAWIVQRLIEAIHKELPLEEVIAGRWDEAVGFGQEVLLRCPELSRILVHVTEACITSVIAYNKKLQEEPQPPKGDFTDEQTVSTTTEKQQEKEEEQVLDVVHEGFRCDSCNVGPIVGSRYRSLGTKDFDLCHTCHKSRPEFESTHGPFERVVTYKPIHFGVVCDGCEASPIVGIRYKSYNAHDFDLCEACEATNKWTSHEPFIKINHPARAPRQVEIFVDRPSASQQEPMTVHPFVTCDGCEASPIIGKRFKSLKVDDFDLCEKCHGSQKWEHSHSPYMEIKSRQDLPMWKTMFEAFRGDGCHPHPHPHPGPHPHPRPHPRPHPGPHPHPHPRPHPHPHPHPGPHPGPHPHPHPHPHPGPHHHHHHGHHHHHHHGRRHHGRHHGHHHGDRFGWWGSQAGDSLMASFVEDVSLPDGTVVAPEVDLVKSWKVKNTGASSWPEGCQLKLQTGRCGVAPFEGEVDVIVPPLNVGEDYIAEVQIRSPSEPGRHRAYWRMCDGEGKFFGHRLWIDLEVSEDLIVPEIIAATINESECVTESDSSSSDEEEEEEDEGVLVSVSSDVESVASSDVTSDTFSAIDDASTASEESDEDSEVGEEDEKTAEVEVEDDEDIVEELYKDALVVLESMGFGDKDQNRRTLAEWGGNLADAVNSLLHE